MRKALAGGLGGFGVVLATTFAPSVITPKWQAFGFIVGVAIMAVAVLYAATPWLRARSGRIDRVCASLGIAATGSPPVLVPDEHRDELRAVVKNAVDQLAHPQPVFWPVNNPRLKAAAAAHFPELTALIRAYSAASRALVASHQALTGRVADECEARGIGAPVYDAHQVWPVIYSRLFAIAEDRMRADQYVFVWRRSIGPSSVSIHQPDSEDRPVAILDAEPPETLDERVEEATDRIELLFRDATKWVELGAVRTAFNTERALLLEARERGDHDMARELIHVVSDCPTCALNRGVTHA